MDYTIIPRTLIYRDKKNLDDFNEANELNAALIKNMADIDILLNRDFEQHALICMNAAYYICTIFMMEKHPVWRLSKLESYIDKLNLHPVAEYKDIIFSIVYLLLNHYNKKWLDNNKDLLEKIYVYIYPDLKNVRVRIEVSLEGGTRDIMQTLNTKLPKNFVLPDDEFAPRIIDCETVSEVIKQPCRWDIITDNFDEDKIRTIRNALAKNPEEERWVLEIFINDVRKNEHISEAVASRKEKMLQKIIDGIELYCLVMDENKDKNYFHIDETSPDVETAHPDETDSLMQRIQELEAENKELKAQKPTKKTNNEDTSSLKQQIADLEKEKQLLSQDKEDMIIELLKPIFFGDEQDVKDFLNIIDGRSDTEITDTVYEYLKVRKISDKSKNRPLWMVLHAARLYRATEQNWTKALREHL